MLFTHPEGVNDKVHLQKAYAKDAWRKVGASKSHDTLALFRRYVMDPF